MKPTRHILPTIFFLSQIFYNSRNSHGLLLVIVLDLLLKSQGEVKKHVRPACFKKNVFCSRIRKISDYLAFSIPVKNKF